ncbi:hypothetical protein AGMMS49928_26770 [Spirochaetia bacterium]|nr:hypothetical protein AGMMS49928_26770 [Spirochaetia bacterium]
MVLKKLFLMFFLLRVILPGYAVDPAADDETARLKEFSDPKTIWGRGVEGIIEEAYRRCFKTYIIGGKVMNLRMPFAQNNERNELSEQDWEFVGGGKADPVLLWETIAEALETEDFKNYTAALSDGWEKVIIFNIPQKTWTTSRDLFDIARMKAGSYRGLPHRPYVLTSGKGIEDSDVYNYLYCVGWTGMDCSGFVWNVLSHIAAAGNLDLGQALRRAMGVPRGGDPSWYAGTSFYNSRSTQISAVRDEIRSLKAGDILLFRGRNGQMVHSAIIQSIDFSAGLIRYLQSTDEAPLDERGVHDSYIRFDPSRDRLSLKDPSLVWTQSRYAPFPGEKSSAFSDDGQRFRAYPESGGGRVVRLKLITGVIDKLPKK